MPGTGPAEFELGDLEAIAEMIEDNLYSMHILDDGPTCENVLECPIEHFDDGEAKQVFELKALLQKTDNQIKALRESRLEEETKG